jgi:hypothetical protein
VKVLVLLILVAIAIAIVARVRYAAKQQREAVLARLTSETAAVGPLSPTEELFRSEGVPVSDELRRSLVGGLTPTPAAPPVPPPSMPTPAVRAASSTAPAAAATAAAATAAPPVTGAALAERTTDVAELFAHMELPAGLVPLVDPASGRDVATFTASSETRRDLPRALGDELSRLGWEVSWIDGATALTRRGAQSAVVRIYDRPEDLAAPDGTPLHPDIAPDRLVVTLTAG